MTHISREYAEALFSLAAEEGKIPDYVQGIDLLEEVLRENPGFQKLLASPAIPREERMEALSRALEGKIPLSMLVLLRLMVKRGHARNLMELAESFRGLMREQQGESRAVVTSAVALTEAEKTALREKLEKRFHRKMELECLVDPAVLGGVRVETEGRVLDGTLRTRLHEIKEVMDT